MQAATELVLEAPSARLHPAVRVVSSFPFLISALLAAKVFWFSGRRIADPDLWWHLANAKYILANFRFPNFDTTCFTTAGFPWTDHEWLSEVIYYLGFRSLGLSGVLLVAGVAYSALWVSVFWLCMRESGDPFVSAVVTEIGTFFGMVGLGPRTQVFGWLCFTGMFAVLMRYRSDRRAPLWILPVIFCVWINLHGSWLIGLVVFAIFIVAGLVKRDIGSLAAAPWSREEVKRLILTALLSVAALFINPFGYRLVKVPFELLMNTPLMAAHVQEFASVNFHDGRGKCVALLLAAIFLAAFAGKKKWRIDDALLTAFVVYSALTYMRFLLMAGIVLPPILAPQIGVLSTYDKNKERRGLNSVLLCVVIAGVLYGLPARANLQQQMDAAFPAGALKYLKTNPVQGRMFNQDAWGGYLQWNMPQTQTFIDTRVDIFQYAGVLQDYLDTVTLNKTEENLKRYDVNYVVYPEGNSFSYYLSHDSHWQRIYGDDQAVIYRRVGNQ